MKNLQSSNHKTPFKLIIYSKELSCKRLRQTHHFLTQKNSTIIIKIHTKKKSSGIFLFIYLYSFFKIRCLCFKKSKNIIFPIVSPASGLQLRLQAGKCLVITTGEESFLKFEEVLDFLLLENSTTCITAVFLRRIRRVWVVLLTSCGHLKLANRPLGLLRPGRQLANNPRLMNARIPTECQIFVN